MAVAGVTTIAQLAAFVKLWIVARYFGVGAELDGYNLAFVAPSLVSGILSSAVQTGLFPVYAALRERAPQSVVTGIERLIFWGLTATCVGISLCAFVFADLISVLLAADGSPPVRQAASFVARFAAFTIVLNIVGDLLCYLLALRERYVIAASAPIANAAIGAIVLLAWPEGRLTALVLGSLLGISIQFAVTLYGAMSNGFRPFGAIPSWRESSGEILEMLRLSAWILPGTALGNIANAVPAVMLVPYGEGAVSAFGYAFRFHQTAVQLVVMAISPIVLSRFSQLVASGNFARLEQLKRQALFGSLAVGVAATLLVAVFGETLLVQLFANGRFDAKAADRVSMHWTWLTVGLAAAIYGTVLSKRFQADRRARELSLLAAAGLISLVLTAYALGPVIKEYSVSAAIVSGALVPALLMNWLLNSSSIMSRQRGAA